MFTLAFRFLVFDQRLGLLTQLSNNLFSASVKRQSFTHLRPLVFRDPAQ